MHSAFPTLFNGRDTLLYGHYVPSSSSLCAPCAAGAAAGLLRLHQGRGHVGHRYHYGRADGRQPAVPWRHGNRPAVHHPAVPGTADVLADGVVPAQPALCWAALPRDAPLADGAPEVRGAAWQGSSTFHAGAAVHGPRQALDGARVPGAPVVCRPQGGAWPAGRSQCTAAAARPFCVRGETASRFDSYLASCLSASINPPIVSHISSTLPAALSVRLSCRSTASQICRHVRPATAI